MSLLDNLEESTEVIKDTLVDENSFFVPTQAAVMTIDTVYLSEYNGSITFNIGFQNSPLTAALYITDNKGSNKGTRKNGDTYFLKDYLLADSLCKVVLNKSIKAAATEVNTLALWDFNAGARTNQEKEVFTELSGKKVILAVLHLIKNKQKKIGEKWCKLADKKEANQIKAFFNAETRLTAKETADGSTVPKFLTDWKKQFGTETVNTYKPLTAKEEEALANDPSQAVNEF